MSRVNKKRKMEMEIEFRFTRPKKSKVGTEVHAFSGFGATRNDKKT